MEKDTFPKLLLRNSGVFGGRVAMRHKEFGIWQTWSWSQLAIEVQNFSLGLAKIGVARGDNVAIIGTNRPVLYWSFCACQALGAVPIPIYSDSVAQEMKYVLSHGEIKFAIAQDQEQVDKLLEIESHLPNLAGIVYDEPRGLGEYKHSKLYAHKKIAAMGKNESAANKQQWEQNIKAGNENDIAVILYTSGTTGQPKGVMLSHKNVIVSAQNANRYDGLNETDEVIAYLPPAWVGDHVFSYAQSICAGYCVCCPESMETVSEDRREIAPTYFFAPPRIFEALLSDIMVRMEDAGKIKKYMFNYFMRVAKNVGEKILNQQSVSIINRAVYLLGEFFVYGPLKNRLGLTKMKVGYTAGEAIGPEIFQFYRSLGLNLKQLYGQTEASVYITAQPDKEIDANSVGKPCEGVEINITNDGEVLYRSPGTFIGYFKDEAATKNTKNSEGWVKTGDAGFIDKNGHLRIIDRAKDVGKLRDGTLFPPKYIENKLKFFPDIKEAVAIGNAKDFVAVIVNIDLPCLASWAERNNIAYASYQELAGKKEVYEIIEKYISKVNADLAVEENMQGIKIKRFAVLHKELDADDEELTRTMKVRRRIIFEKYQVLIDAIYAGKTSTFVETAVTFEDGKKGKLSATINIKDVA